MERNAEVVVIGGGSTGTSVLYNLADQGVKDSILVERGSQVASGQTGRSNGVIRTHYSNPVVTNMALLSFRFFQRFESVVGYSCGFRKTGLLVGSDSNSEEGLMKNISMYKVLGIDSRLIDEDEAKKIERELNTSSFSSIVYEPEAGYADPSLTTAAFAKSAQSLGAKVLTNTEVFDIERKSQGYYDMITTNGSIRARKIVIATGVWSKKLFEKLKLLIPLKPTRTAIIIFRRPENYLGLRPIIFDFVRKAFYKPEGQQLLFASGLELELSSSGEVDPDSYNQDVSNEEIVEVSRRVSESIPIMRKGSYQGAYTGVYDITPDEQPIIDELSSEGYEGLYCLVGLSGHGFKFCPEFGRIMGKLIVDGKFSDYDISIFARKRFREEKLIRSNYRSNAVVGLFRQQHHSGVADLSGF